jgi:2-polyprenyl-3-methyl-5-hydroxy-6-metoxy-1,4-benzoquinol methylase
MENEQIKLGRYASYWCLKTPRRLLHSMSYYKFASKIIGKEKKVLDIGCNEGLGTWLLAKECGYAKGLDFDEEAIDTAKKNFNDAIIKFDCQDILSHPLTPTWDAIVNFDVIEHILPENTNRFMEAIKSGLKEDGVLIIGSPSQISQQFASEISKKGHINIHSPEEWKQLMQKHFENVFIFAANDEVVHTGYMELAHYLIAVCCNKKL